MKRARFLLILVFVFFTYASGVRPLFAQEASPSAVGSKTNSSLATTSATNANLTTSPLLKATPIPNTPTPSPAQTTLLSGKNRKQSQEKSLDLYFDRSDFQAKENPSFLVTVQTVSSTVSAQPTISSSLQRLQNFLPFLSLPRRNQQRFLPKSSTRKIIQYRYPSSLRLLTKIPLK